MKKILMSMRVTGANNYKEERNSIAYEYIKFFEELGYLVILIPNNTKNISLYFDLDIEFVVLSGGNNVSPKLYSSDYHLEDVYEERDIMENELLSLALEKKLPILGICRGFHFLNVYFGGSIMHKVKNHVNSSHILKSKNILLDKKEVNSFHNQSILINNLSSQLSVLAMSEDSTIEAFSSNDKKVLGIQWHPERQNKEYDKQLIKIFLQGQL